MYIVTILALAILVLVSVSIAQVYRSLPLIELKRRARHGDGWSKSVYRVAVYKFSAQFLLWLIASLASAVFFVIVSRKSPVWLALTSCVALIWVAFIWIPRSSINLVSEYLAKVLSSPISWLLRHIDPITSFLHETVTKTNKVSHTGIYEKADVIDLLKRQNKQADSRIDPFEIEMMKRLLDFNDKKVIDVMTPKRKVTAVSVNDTLGPIILSELHKSGQVQFPVYDKKVTNIVGVIDISLLTELKQTSTAKSTMTNRIAYAHEEEGLSSLLKTMMKVHQQLFVVINSHEEYTGVITEKAILSELVGEHLAEDFDQHENKEAVARRFEDLGDSPSKKPEDDTEVIE